MQSKSVLFSFAVLALGIPMLVFADGHTTSNNEQQTQTQTARQAENSSARISVGAVVAVIETPAPKPCVQVGKHTCPNWNDGPAFHK